MKSTYTLNERMCFELAIQTSITAVELMDISFSQKMDIKAAIQKAADKYPEQRIMKPALNTQSKN